ncbi:MAG: hypothetical protein RL215_3340 [Planctomycetota bacterium]
MSGFGDGNAECVCGASPFDFCDAFGEAFSADGYAEWNSDEVSILEFEAGALIAVVHEDVDAGILELSVDLVGDLHDLWVGDIEWDELDGIGGCLEWPDDAIFVVAGFDDGGDDASDADAVAAHDDGV